MPYAFSLPTKSDKVPAGDDWIHEVKYDGYRMMVVRDQDRVRLISRGGHDWAQRFPLIVASALKLRQKRFVIDGEVVVLRLDGNSDFDALASRQHDKRAQFYAFDMLSCAWHVVKPSLKSMVILRPTPPVLAPVHVMVRALNCICLGPPPGDVPPVPTASCGAHVPTIVRVKTRPVALM
jgi:hypothetical protein